jgi:hypothetical protein
MACFSWSWKPLIHSLTVRKLSQLSFSGQPRPPLGPLLLPDYLLASSRLPPRPCKGPYSILSHSHTISLSLFYLGPPTHLPLAHFLTYHHPFPIGQPIPLDSYITSYLFALGSLIALMMEAARTSETSVYICLTKRQNIPEDSELHTRCRKNL